MAPSNTGIASSPVQEDGVTAAHRLRSYRVPGQDRFRACLPGPAGALRVVRPNVVHVQSRFQVGRDLLTAAVGVGYPTVAANHFMPENMLQHPQVPDVLADRAWRDLVRAYGAADVVTAPTPRAVSCGIDLSRFGADGVAPERCCSWAGWSGRSGSTS